MPFVSSPVAYPPTSSPHEPSPRKKRKLQNDREPLHTSIDDGNAGQKTVAGFVIDDDSDDEGLGKSKSRETRTFEQTCSNTWNEANSEDARNIDRVQELGTSTRQRESTPQERKEESQVELDAFASLTPLRWVLRARNCSGEDIRIARKPLVAKVHYEKLVASRSTTAAGRAQKSYYGIDIHHIIDEANAERANSKIEAETQAEAVKPSVEQVLVPHNASAKPARTTLWTEKYRARKFTDLVGDERTHRAVLRWLKVWDSIVFPHQARPKIKVKANDDDGHVEKAHRKILLLTGPPGLGKTTLAHVCAKQAGYEVQEINASDERSRDVVKGRIRDMVGTENVRSLDASVDGKMRKATRPVCVVVDEVDGVTSGSSGGGGEGGFVKALIDLLAQDLKTSSNRSNSTTGQKAKSKGEKFRMLRPIILICNDIYHPSLRLLRQGTYAEIIHVRKPPLSMVVPRLQAIFQREGVPCDGDGVRQLCEATWGVASRKESRSGAGGTGEGDMRGILVIAEWVASKFRTALATTLESGARLTRRWLETHVLNDLAHGGGAARGLGRSGSKEVVERVFMHNAGFTLAPVAKQSKPAPERASTQVAHVAESGKRQVLERLREMIESSNEDDRIMTGKHLLPEIHFEITNSINRLFLKLSPPPFPRRHPPHQAQPRQLLARLSLHPLASNPHKPRLGPSALPLLPRPSLPHPLLLRHHHKSPRQRLRPARPRRPQRPKTRPTPPSYPSRPPSRLRNYPRKRRNPRSLPHHPLPPASALLPRHHRARHRARPLSPARAQPRRQARRRRRQRLRRFQRRKRRRVC